MISKGRADCSLGGGGWSLRSASVEVTVICTAVACYFAVSTSSATKGFSVSFPAPSTKLFDLWATKGSYI